ncbi:peptide transporter [Suicoccus acidiformans]|uniref:Peptide transporter n=1 Tax=Suicoccus acidiformans TaxID=2036206 RepID=A0A347WJ73_9LACT|nr:metal ABC transporter ATP-binding protein [Suicoccus acidiformans]AXY25130.1 peptide transporter [Suicoccus acidiformans]
MTESIQVKHLTVAYEGNPVLWDVNVHFNSGRITAIVGPNGAGKSTLLNAMLGFLKPISGEVDFNVKGQQNVSYDKVKQEVAYVPQKSSVDWNFPTTAFDVVLMGRYGHLRFAQRPRKEDKKIARLNLEKVGMSSFANRQISQLSGGQRQRVFLARALCEEAEIIILDEPLAGVDIKTEKVLMDLLRQEANRGKTVIAVHHDLNTVEEYFDDVIFLNREIVTFGSVDTTFTQENIDETYKQDRNLGDSIVAKTEASDAYDQTKARKVAGR